jgi:hypothetical protein
MKSINYLFMLIAILLFFCTDKCTDANNSINSLIGLWQKDTISNGCNWSLLFFPNGIFSNRRFNCSEAGFSDGTYSISGNSIFLENPGCEGVFKGEYRFSLDNQKLIMILVKDSCGRKEAIPGKYTKLTPQNLN